MNYRLLLSEMLIDYQERMVTENNSDRKSVYKEVLRDLNISLEIEVREIARNPISNNDQWLIAEQYFKDNFEPRFE